MGVRSAGDENPRDQEYCSECGQPIPSAAQVQATQALRSQADETEPEAAVELPPVSSQGARASAPPPPAAGDAATRPTVGRSRSRPRPAAPRSGESGSPREPLTKPWYRKPRLVVLLSILALILAVAAVGFGALLGGKSKSGATTQSPASSQSPVPNKQSAASKKQSPVSKWAAKNRSKIERLPKSLKATADADVAGPNTSALRSACQELADASRAAAAVLPAPNAALTDALRGAVDDFDKAAQECITGVDSADPATRDRFRSDLKAGQNQIGVAAYILQRFNKGS
jgi:hypothetical protein